MTIELTAKDTEALLELISSGEVLAAMASNAGPDRYVEGRYALRTSQQNWDKCVKACEQTFAKLRESCPEWNGVCFGDTA